MLLNHLLGMYSHPQQEWQTIDRKHENLIYSVSHILIIALVPAICGYFSATYLSLPLPNADSAALAFSHAFTLYCLLIGGVFALAAIAWQLARAFAANQSYTQAVELASYASTPLFMAGFCVLYPEIWFITLICVAGLAYSAYLLVCGVPILIHIRPHQRRRYSLALIGCGSLLLVGLVSIQTWIWF